MNSDYPKRDSSLTDRDSENDGITRRELLVITAKSAAGLTLAPLSSVLADEQKGIFEPVRVMMSELLNDDPPVGFHFASSATSAISHLAGDINCDGRVDEEDLEIMASEWLTGDTSAISNLDFSHTHIPGSATSAVYVDFQDYSIMAKDWRENCFCSACSAITHLAGDINRDSKVDAEDLEIMASEWLTSDASAISNLDSSHAHIPGSATSAVYVNFQDYSIMAKDW